MSMGNQSTSMGQSNREATATEDMRRKAGEVKQNVAELGSVAKAAATEKLGELKDSANEYYEMGRDRMYEAEQSLEDYIRQQPVKAVAFAAGIGFLFGACYMRR